MPGMNWELLSADERLVAEQAVMNLRELKCVCRAAEDGTVLAVAETLGLSQGRDLILKSMELTLKEEGREVEKKGRRPGDVPAD